MMFDKISKIQFLILITFFSLALPACDGENNLDLGLIGHLEQAAIKVQPNQLSLFGHNQISVTNLSFDISDDLKMDVFIGDYECLEIIVKDKNSFECLSQGKQTPGAASLYIMHGDYFVELPQAINFTPAKDSVFNRLIVLGGAVAAGVRDESLSFETQLNSFPAQLAKSLNAHLPMPIVDLKGFPKTQTLIDLDPDTATLDYKQINDSYEFYLEHLDELHALRLNPNTKVYNLAIPYGGTASEVMEGQVNDGSDNIQSTLFNELINPAGRENSNLQIDKLIKLEPDIIISGYGLIDYIDYFKRNTGWLNESEITQELKWFFNRIATSKKVPYFFILNYPPANIFPENEHSEWERYQSIWINNALFEAIRYANAIDKVKEPRFFVADLFTFFSLLSVSDDNIKPFDNDWQTGISENGESNFVITDSAGQNQSLGFDMFEGVFSFDKKTYTETGNAILANLIIFTINFNIGSKGLMPKLINPVLYLNLPEILANDPQSPLALSKQITAQKLKLEPKKHADEQGIRPMHVTNLCAIKWENYVSERDIFCPSGMYIYPSGDSLTINAGETIEFLVTIYAKGDTSNYPVAAHSRYGSINDMALVDKETEKAKFTYTAPLEHASDVVRFVTGDIMQTINVSVLD